eukprot:2284910-Karenia_brevis.AAC.1
MLLPMHQQIGHWMQPRQSWSRSHRSLSVKRTWAPQIWKSGSEDWGTLDAIEARDKLGIDTNHTDAARLLAMEDDHPSPKRLRRDGEESNEAGL